ncbi:lanthionine synthetase LanC family protein [Streptomyces sp. NPDC051211]|uniref:lanthionine synthetase LanC family protein n=1 Tax=Streptomyces sp. NPDC051211 TaxID=3154643 RepID=UPI00344E7B10
MHPAPLLPASLAARADAVASLIRERLDTPERADAHAVRAAGQTDMSFWTGASLSEGYAGLALLHLHASRGARDETDRKRSLDRAFAFVRAAFSATQESPLTHPGLFDGMAGLAFVLQDVSVDEQRFLPSLARLHEQLARHTLAMELPRRSGAVAGHHFDLVYGSAGVLAQLCAAPSTTPLVEQALERCLDHLVWVGNERRWAVGGRLCTGMSHGAAGIAAALAAAWRHGHRLPGQRLVLDRLVEWLLWAGTAEGRRLQWPKELPSDSRVAPGVLPSRCWPWPPRQATRP